MMTPMIPGSATTPLHVGAQVAPFAKLAHAQYPEATAIVGCAVQACCTHCTVVNFTVGGPVIAGAYRIHAPFSQYASPVLVYVASHTMGQLPPFATVVHDHVP